MGNIKVYELAKKMGIQNSEMIEKLKKIGADVKSHLSVVEESVVNRVLGQEKNKKMEDKKQEQMHIIRRNVRVINTDGEKKEVEQITTSIAGDVKKTKTVVDTNKKQEKVVNKNNSNNGSSNGNNKFGNRRPKFGANRNSNVVITRNGKPVENVKANEEKAKNTLKENTNENQVNKNAQNTKNDAITELKNPSNNTNNVNNTKKVEKDKEERKTTSNYNKKDNNNNHFNKNNQNRNSQNPNYNKNNNSNFNDRQNKYKNDNQNNGYRNNSKFRNNDSNSQGYKYNSTYKVDKFMKQSSMPIEQKETKEYNSNNIDKDKKRFNEKGNNENKKEKLDKNKLRERNSRVATSKLRGMEINSEGLIDLYERDTDSAKRSANKKSKKAKQTMNQTKIIPMTEVKLPDVMTVKEFAEKIKKQASEIIKKLFALGTLATVNQDIDFDTAYLIAQEFGITAEKEVVVTEEDILFDDSEDKEEDLKPRPPIVVVMGHVDHGKTSLLDRLRSSNVVSGEAGGITQHIGAYKVEINGREICFLDTPGHEAFTAMRARGAQVTDIAIIVVAADDGIKPQTIEAIDHAKSAGVSIVVAINKIDKPTANVERVKQELLEVGLVPEEWGGDTICVPISAMTGEGIDTLLEMLLLVADMKDLKANPNKQSKGTVLEARLDQKRGTIVSMLVQRGTLNVGDTIVVGDMVSHIRAMKDDKGRKVKEAGPSTPVEVLGLSHVPETGDIFYEVDDEKTAKQLIEKRKADARKKMIKQGSKVTLDDLFGQIKEGMIKELNVIIKADVQGSVEALKNSLEKLSNDQVRVRILHAATGAIKETDVTLASVSNAIIIGFNVRPETQAALQADKEKVDMRLYTVIYDAIGDVETALKGMIPKKYKEVMLGTAEIRKIFKITGVGIVAGCYVKSGKIVRNQMVRVVRDNIVLLTEKIDNLKREKDEVKDVAEGYECGIKLEKFSDIKEGDILECYELVEEKV